MNYPDPYRPLTPEEAERIAADCPECPMTPEELDSLTRKTLILIGEVPVSDLTADEVLWHLRHRMRLAGDEPPE